MIGKTPQLDLLSQMLDAMSVRHSVIAQNIANLNTPNYHCLQVSFDTELSRALSGSDATPVVTTTISESTDSSPRPDGNNVDIDEQLGLLDKNTMMASAAMQFLATQIGQLRSAITGR
jgi:flagellar basal-body rod protein FlgB